MSEIAKFTWGILVGLYLMYTFCASFTMDQESIRNSMRLGDGFILDFYVDKRATSIVVEKGQS